MQELDSAVWAESPARQVHRPLSGESESGCVILAGVAGFRLRGNDGALFVRDTFHGMIQTMRMVYPRRNAVRRSATLMMLAVLVGVAVAAEPRAAESAEPPNAAAVELPPLSDAAVQAGVIADELITLGGECGASKVQTVHRVRRITVQPPEDRPDVARQGRVRKDRNAGDEFILATTLLDLPAEQVVLLYKYRWQVELFFRFLKHVLNCQTLLSAKTTGVQVQLYCAMIAALLFVLVTGNNLSKRDFEMICLFYAGWADEDELLEALQKQTSKPP